MSWIMLTQLLILMRLENFKPPFACAIVALRGAEVREEIQRQNFDLEPSKFAYKHILINWKRFQKLHRGKTLL